MRTACFFLFVFEIVNAFSLCAQNVAEEAVDPFHGADNRGNTFVGAAMPFSMVKPGPDSWMPSRWLNSNSGYGTGQSVCGFSQTHVSGTGGAAKYGHFRVMPMIGDVNRRDCSEPVRDEIAAPGYYAATLAGSEIRCELTLTPHVAYHRYTAGRGDSLNVLFDVSSLLDKGSTPQHLLESGVEILSPREMTGYCRSEGGWNEGAPYTVYFYARFDREASGWGTFREGRLSRGNCIERSINPHDHTRKAAYMTFPLGADRTVTLKMGISFVSGQKARENYEAEAGDLSFDRARAKAREMWNTYLGRLDVKCSDPGVRTMIYNGLYRALLMPVDRTGEMPGWGNTVCYDDFYAIWDTFRTALPLLGLIAPEKLADMVNALVSIGEREGFMPDARSGNWTGLTQGGSNCDVVIADAYVKKIGGIDYRAAWRQMRRNAETEPDAPRRYGRGGVVQFDTLGYVSDRFERSGTRQMEYAYCDFALWQLAKGLGDTAAAVRYLDRSRRWTALWNPDAEDSGFRGFVWPKQENGIWREKFSALTVGSWRGVFYEGTSWQYSLYAPHDVERLIALCGGREEFVRRLDFFFEKGFAGEKGFYNVGNEPSFLTPCLYIWAGRYDLTACRVREIGDRYYRPGRAGLPGNDDSGAMSSWYAFHALGLYPNAAQDYYLLTSPRIEHAELCLPEGKTFRIIVRHAAPDHIYIRSARLNGHPINRAWIRHAEIVAGGELELTMGAEPSGFGRKNLPPSLPLSGECPNSR